MYVNRDGTLRGYGSDDPGLGDIFQDIVSGAKRAVSGFLRGGAPGAVSAVTGRPTTGMTPREALEEARRAAIESVARRPDVQPILQQEALKAALPLLIGVGILTFALSKRR